MQSLSLAGDWQPALRKRLERTLAGILPPAEVEPSRLHKAMRYATLGEGKRIRPLLVYATGSAIGIAPESLDAPAAAVELIHAYSLVHDDLPAMDDSDLRRGRPSVHKQFDEATAILAGDALLTLAFEVLAAPETHGNPQVRADLVRELARAAGAQGMVGGQMLDLLAENSSLDIGAITRLQRMKTGEMIAFACCAGAILGNGASQARQALHAYAHDLGLAFQIVDDLLDAEGSEASVGKPVGRDAAAGKATFVSILGIERARTQAEQLARQAAQHLDFFEEKADLLRAVPGFVIARRR